MGTVVARARMVRPRHWRGEIEGVTHAELAELRIDLNGSARTVRERATRAVKQLFEDGTECDFRLVLSAPMTRLQQDILSRRAELEKALQGLRKLETKFAMRSTEEMALAPPEIANLLELPAQRVRKMLTPGWRSELGL